jgi:lauroyl/myristoyl acyltransferase
MPSRHLRPALVSRLIGLTRVAPAPLVLALRPMLAAALASAPSLRTRLERSMAAALGETGYEPRHVTGYFRRLADLLAFSCIAYRSGIHGTGLERAWSHDPSLDLHVSTALAGGRGAVMVCPHLILHEIMAATGARKFPITVLARQSPDPRYERIKQNWYSALGFDVVARPRKSGPHQSLVEMTGALRALRKNRILALTPDLIQKPGSGIPVRLFGRTAELPAGPFFLAVRTGAPLLPVFFHHDDARYRMWTPGEISVDEAGDRDSRVADAAQQWTALFEEFVRAHPDMWQFWLDKRWARWLEVS